MAIRPPTGEGLATDGRELLHGMNGAKQPTTRGIDAKKKTTISEQCDEILIFFPHILSGAGRCPYFAHIFCIPAFMFFGSPFENSSKILRKFYKNSSKILQKTFENSTKNLQKTFKKPSKNLQKTFKFTPILLSL